MWRNQSYITSKDSMLDGGKNWKRFSQIEFSWKIFPKKNRQNARTIVLSTDRMLEAAVRGSMRGRMRCNVVLTLFRWFINIINIRLITADLQEQISVSVDSPATWIRDNESRDAKLPATFSAGLALLKAHASALDESGWSWKIFQSR